MISSEKRILIASDHAGLALKLELTQRLTEWEWEDLGPHQESSVDYPDYAQTLGLKISFGENQSGVLICGTGVGMAIAANKIQGVRAVCTENPFSARLSREHNDANVLCLGSRLLATQYAAEIVQVWLRTPFSKDPRHIQRVKKIFLLEKNNPRKNKMEKE